MSSKWCPKCGRINSVYRSIPKFCMWGCGSLREEPLVPENIMKLGYLRAVDYARDKYKERHRKLKQIQKAKEVLQLKLF